MTTATTQEKLSAHLLGQIERCGLSGKLAELHREVGDDKRGSRIAKQEIARAWGAMDQPTIPEAVVAHRWLFDAAAGDSSRVRSVGTEIDLVDPDSGEVLASGRAGAVIVQDSGVGLVVEWVIGEHYDYPEPEDDLGLLALGLAAFMGKPFQIGQVWIVGGFAACRRSPEYPVVSHASILDRIRQAKSRPRVACPGDWCGTCRQRPYCHAWVNRAHTALQVFEDETRDLAGKVEAAAPVMELDDDKASAFAARIRDLKKALEWAEDVRNDYARRGGTIILDGKKLYMAGRDGRRSVSVSAVEAKVAKYRELAASATDMEKVVLLSLADELNALIVTGMPYEQATWKKPQAIRRAK